MKKKLFMMISVLTIMLLGVQTVYAAEAGISTDGDFSDWNNIPKQQTAGHPYYESTGLVYDDTYIYLYVKEKPSEPWANWLPTVVFNVDGTSKEIRIGKVDYTNADGTFALSVANSWSQTINNASGSITRENGANTWEVKIPIRAAFTENGEDGAANNAVPCDVSNITAAINNNGSLNLTAIDRGNTTETQNPGTDPETGEGSEGTGEKDDGDGSGGTTQIIPGGGSGRPLSIDGYFDDWNNIPKTLISYGSHNSDGTINEYHNAAMVVRDGYVYVYVRMSDLYQTQIPVDELKFAINGQEKSFVIRGRNDQNYIDWNKSPYNLPNGINGGFGVFYRDGGSVALGEAVLTISEANPNDTMEFRMSVAELEKLYGLEEGTIENGAKLEFYSPNIGPDKVTTVGTSTGTYMGIGLSIAAVLCVFWYRSKRKRAVS